ncbi:MAG: hypothetical protein U0R49_09045 [Fimbriimonadales bacterium]
MDGILTSTIAALSLAVAPMTEITARLNLAQNGQEANDTSSFPVLSKSGRIVAFRSNASDLVPGDTNQRPDVFVRDLATGKLARCSVSSSGQQGNFGSSANAISANDRFVLFFSAASNLVDGDTNGSGDIFLRDLQLNATERVSIGNDGHEGNGIAGYSDISGDGRYVAFDSDATNLVEGDTNGRRDVFLRDRWLGTTVIVSVSSDGQQGDYDSWQPRITPDGRFVCFNSQAGTLVEGDLNIRQDVFIHDMWTGETERVSLRTDGGEGNGDSGLGAVTPDGRFVSMQSSASNFASGDTNRTSDGFVYDRWKKTITRVSVRSDGGQGNHGGGAGGMTDDGRYVLIGSPSTNLTDDGDINDRLLDVFMHDMWSGETWRISNNTNGEQGNAQSEASVMSANGMIVAFASNATNLAPNDTNGFMDIFVHINSRLRR